MPSVRAPLGLGIFCAREFGDFRQVEVPRTTAVGVEKRASMRRRSDNVGGDFATVRHAPCGSMRMLTVGGRTYVYHRPRSASAGHIESRNVPRANLEADKIAGILNGREGFQRIVVVRLSVVPLLL